MKIEDDMTHRQLSLVSWLLAAFVALTTPGFASAEKIAFVKDGEIFAMNEESSDPVQLTDDGTLKGFLQWSPGGDLLAYVQMVDPSIAYAQTTVIDSTGSVVMKTLIQKGSQKSTARFRGIRYLRWFDVDSLGVYGEYNTLNCGLILLQPSTGTIVRQQAFDCRYYDVSPDGQHIVHYGYGVRARESDFVYIDSEPLIYPKDPEHAKTRISADPQWSPDSASVAFVARDPNTGNMSVAVADKNGAIVEQRISPTFADGSRLGWSGNSVIVTGDNLAIHFDPAARRWRVASPAEEASIAALDSRKRAESDRKKALSTLSREKGWTKAASWDGDEESPR